MHGPISGRGQAAMKLWPIHASVLYLCTLLTGTLGASLSGKGSHEGDLSASQLRVEISSDGSASSMPAEVEQVNIQRQQMRKERSAAINVVYDVGVVSAESKDQSPCPNDKHTPQTDGLGADEDPFLDNGTSVVAAEKKLHPSAEFGGRRRFTPYEGNLSTALDGVKKTPDEFAYHEYYYDTHPAHGADAGHKSALHPQPNQTGCSPLLTEIVEEVRADLARKHAAGIATPHEQAALEQFSAASPAEKFSALQEMISLQTLGDVLESGMNRLITTTELKELNTCLRVEPGAFWPGEESEPVVISYLSTFCQLIEGDIAVCNGLPGHSDANESTAMPANSSLMQSARASAKVDTYALWPHGRVRYCFQHGISPRAKAAVEMALAHISSQVPCVSFQQVDVSPMEHETCAENPAVFIKSEGPAGDGRCWSMLGKVATDHTSQLLNLGPGCEFKGLAIHQLAHTLGMFHEQARPDRDMYLRVWEANITGDLFVENFAVNPAADKSTTIYDMLSVMHFDAFAFSADGRSLTLEPSDLRLVRFMGQRVGFSELDARLLGHMYGCGDSIVPENRNAALSELLLFGHGMESSPGCKDRNPTDFQIEGRHAQCHEVQHMCTNSEVGAQVSAQCPVTCFRCIPCLPTIAHNCNATGDESLKSETFGSEVSQRTEEGNASMVNATEIINVSSEGQQHVNATVTAVPAEATSPQPGPLRDAGAADGRKGWGLQPQRISNTTSSDGSDGGQGTPQEEAAPGSHSPSSSGFSRRSSTFSSTISFALPLAAFHQMVATHWRFK
mmetsp:Transcript_21906/g.51193  ORF Transcript_21906/g.51193 Transcript_21906/m.51193 type:complete len:789 (-) Transcript_21906:5-2371(-)